MERFVCFVTGGAMEQKINLNNCKTSDCVAIWPPVRILKAVE
jgi:hypothetical protein